MDFGDDLTTEIEPENSPERPPPRTTPTPNTSAKRRKLESDSARPAVPAANNVNQNSKQSLGRPDPYELQEGSSTEFAHPADEQPTTSPNAVEEHDPGSAESLPPSRPPIPAPPISPVSRRVASENTEVEESPVDAPGSGRRRTIMTSSAVASSARLQQAFSPDGENETETVPISSPLERKVRRNTTSTRRSTLSSHGSRNSGISAVEDLDEPSPDRTTTSIARQESPELSYRHDTELDESTVPEAETELEPATTQLGLEPEPEPESIVEERDHDESLAEEVDANEAAQRLGRKRPRRSPRRSSPEPDSTVVDEDREEPLSKRRRKQSQKSPAKQKQGRPKAAPKAKDSSPKAAPKRRKKRGSDNAEVEERVSIPVQRFTKGAQLAEGDDNDIDVLALDIPFTGRGGVNTVDVLTQMCDEIIGTSLDTLKEGVRNAQDASTKKEYRVQLRALEAYQEELRSRLLQHVGVNVPVWIAPC